MWGWFEGLMVFWSVCCLVVWVCMGILGFKGYWCGGVWVFVVWVVFNGVVIGEGFSGCRIC